MEQAAATSQGTPGKPAGLPHLGVRQRQGPQAQVGGGVGDGAQHKLDGVDHLGRRGK